MKCRPALLFFEKIDFISHTNGERAKKLVVILRKKAISHFRFFLFNDECVLVQSEQTKVSIGSMKIYEIFHCYSHCLPLAIYWVTRSTFVCYVKNESSGDRSFQNIFPVEDLSVQEKRGVCTLKKGVYETFKRFFPWVHGKNLLKFRIKRISY